MNGFEAVIGHGTAMQITWWQMSIRAVIIFLYGVVLLRLAGRRAFGRQSALDIVLTVLIGSNLSRAMTGGSPFLPTIAGSGALVLLHYASIHLTQRSDVVGFLLKGERRTLVRDGSPDPVAMRQVGVSDRDLREAIRLEGVEELSDVKLAALERSGHISVVKRKG
jgi:uncharacterized membrane protein YcaP (DUF421 family)